MWISPLVARAGRAFIAAKGKDPEIEGAPLAEWLRSGAEIGDAEREMLAQLVTGEWGRDQGRPGRVGPGHPYAVAIVARYRELCDQYGKRQTLAAKQDTAAEFGETVRTVERYEQEARKREQAIAKAQAPLRQ